MTVVAYVVEHSTLNARILRQGTLRIDAMPIDNRNCEAYKRLRRVRNRTTKADL